MGSVSYKAKFAILGAILVPCFGRLALHGTGFEHNLYRYFVPLFVGGLSGYLIGFMKDKWLVTNKDLITTNAVLRKEINEHEQAEDRLKKSEQRFRDLFNAINDVIYTHDLEGRFISVNPALCKAFGYEEDELIGRRASDFMKPEFALAFKSEYLEQLKKQERHDGTTIYFKKNGEKIYLEYRSVSIRPEDGKPFISGTGRDVTERVLSERKVAKLQEQLAQAQKMEAIGTLAGGIAHDFNNILFPMFGYLEMVLQDLPKGNPLRGQLVEVLNGAKRARDLVKQILAFSRQSDHDMKPMKVHLVLKEALQLIKSSLPSTIKITQNIQSDCGLVFSDSTQIHQIVMNLCTNAYHAMEETGGKLTVNLKEVELTAEDLKDQTMVPGTHVCLTVADTGPGMEQSVIDRIFDPYFTTKEKGKGTGLGLAVVDGIVKSHGGHISVYSEPGKGTEFKVFLPVIKTKEEEHQVETDTPIQKGNERILLVDDQDMVAQMEKQMLERLGYHVTVRTSSTDALEAFRTQPDKFDVVITDMTMPNMTGDKLAAELIKIRPAIPIILCTGFSEMMSKEKAAALGIKGFLMKPVVMKDLSSIIRKVLDDE
jgi:PAS domain S-box-containing protein